VTIPLRVVGTSGILDFLRNCGSLGDSPSKNQTDIARMQTNHGTPYATKCQQACWWIHVCIYIYVYIYIYYYMCVRVYKLTPLLPTPTLVRTLEACLIHAFVQLLCPRRIFWWWRRGGDCFDFEASQGFFGVRG